MKIVVVVLTAHKVKEKEKEKDADQKRKQGVEAPPAQSVTFKSELISLQSFDFLYEFAI